MSDPHPLVLQLRFTRREFGHARLPEFVGNIDTEAPYVPEPRG